MVQMTHMGGMTRQELAAWVSENLHAQAQLVTAHAERAVPSCPGWTVADVTRHTASLVGGWYSHNLVPHPAVPSDTDFIMQGLASAPEAPENTEDIAGFVDRVAGDFVELVETVDLEEPVWAWFPEPKPAWFWLLRAASETAIHRWDVENAVGVASGIAPERGAVLLEEMLAQCWPGYVEYEWPSFILPAAIELPTSPLGIRTTDAGRSWRVESANGAVAVRETDDLPETVIEGTAGDLLLFLHGRRTADQHTASGSPEVVRSWNLWGIFADTPEIVSTAKQGLRDQP